ncbi:MAG: KUP/HAK/KT family potassium transporter [Pseudonocardia sp.]|nr:KUP/HAK/KT family potassium transporter [Pseudonocardia sp.]
MSPRVCPKILSIARPGPLEGCPVQRHLHGTHGWGVRRTFVGQTSVVSDTHVTAHSARHIGESVETESGEPQEIRASGNLRHAAAHGSGLFGLGLGALGVVFGDIGTSPLYAMRSVFSIGNQAMSPTAADLYGVVSLIFWSVTLIVTIKYVWLVIRADNDGEGGVMALAALVRSVCGTNRRYMALALSLGVFGAALFYGDSVITPAISVLSAVEGLQIVRPSLAEAVVPVGIGILAVLFVVQRWGTHRVGRMFGPVMLLWFTTLAVLGVPRIVRHPDVLRGLSPTYIVSFVADHPSAAFLTMGAVVLAITGAEALYADIGHFGRRPIRVAWFAVVFPALILNYLGQAALTLDDPRATANPFYLLAPDWARLPLVVLATCATVIASQAVISGAFSVSRQAARLGVLPPLTVRHTSTRESGQIYLPAINALLFGGVLAVLVTFRSSNGLAAAYGLAVTGTLLLTTTLFVMYAAIAWRWARWRLVLVAVVIGGVELSYLAANLTKISQGAWLPLVVAAVVVTVMMTWRGGHRIVAERRIELEGRLPEFIEGLHDHRVARAAGTAIFPHPSKLTAPLALRANAKFNHVVHERVVIVSVLPEDVPHVPRDERLSLDELGHSDDGFTHLSVRFGFHDDQDIPGALRDAHRVLDELDPDTASYFLSHLSIEPGDHQGMSTWRKRLFIALARNAANPAAYFRLPDDRTVVIGARIKL